MCIVVRKSYVYIEWIVVMSGNGNRSFSEIDEYRRIQRIQDHLQTLRGTGM